VGNELYNKKLGVVGLGKIGSHVGPGGQGDGHGGARLWTRSSPPSAPSSCRCSCWRSSLCSPKADYISLHLPRTPDTEHLVDGALLQSMKPTARLVNCARGGIVDEQALAEALEAGTIAGAALDVYSNEPLEADSPLRRVRERLILTPHLGASTAEAQETSPSTWPEQNPRRAIGPAGAQRREHSRAHPGSDGGSSAPISSWPRPWACCSARWLEDRYRSWRCGCRGRFANHPSQPLVVGALKGLLSSALGDRIKLRECLLGGEEPRIHVVEVKDDTSRDFAGGSLQLTSRGSQGSHSVTGAVFAEGDLRITTIDEFPVNVAPSRHMLFTRHRDMPGIIGQLGSLLGEHNVNIASMQVGRRIVRGDAVMVAQHRRPDPPQPAGPHPPRSTASRRPIPSRSDPPFTPVTPQPERRADAADAPPLVAPGDGRSS